MELNPVVLFELDVVVPAQQFRIEYTLVDKGGYRLYRNSFCDCSRFQRCCQLKSAIILGLQLKS